MGIIRRTSVLKLLLVTGDVCRVVLPRYSVYVIDRNTYWRIMSCKLIATLSISCIRLPRRLVYVETICGLVTSVARLMLIQLTNSFLPLDGPLLTLPRICLIDRIDSCTEGFREKRKVVGHGYASSYRRLFAVYRERLVLRKLIHVYA